MREPLPFSYLISCDLDAIQIRDPLPFSYLTSCVFEP